MTYAEKLRAVASLTNAGQKLLDWLKAQMTPRQVEAAEKRAGKLAGMKDRQGIASYRACVGCLSGVRSWDQGSDYCGRCLK